MSLAVLMIARSGRTKRPAISQPAVKENTAMIARTATSSQNAAEPTVRGMRVECPAVTAPGETWPPGFMYIVLEQAWCQGLRDAEQRDT